MLQMLAVEISDRIDTKTWGSEVVQRFLKLNDGKCFLKNCKNHNVRIKKAENRKLSVFVWV